MMLFEIKDKRMQGAMGPPGRSSGSEISFKLPCEMPVGAGERVAIQWVMLWEVLSASCAEGQSVYVL